MEPAGLTTLPVEVIQHMSLYLSVQDILSCSLTCHYLRAALNDDFVWKRYLKKDAARLEDQESQVSPHFCFQDDLMPLCKNRQHFMRKTHLVNNLRAGRFVEYKSSICSGFGSGLLFQPMKGHENVIYNDKYIFLGRYNHFDHNDGIEIWDVSKEPTYYTSLKIKNEHYYKFYIVGSYLIITECRKVHVYNITLPEKEFPPLHSFFVTGEIGEQSDIVCRGFKNCDISRWNHAFVDNYMMSHQAGTNILEIWDIKNATKVGAFQPPKVSPFIELHSYTGNLCLFKLITRDYLSHNYLVSFNLKHMQFCDRSIEYKRENAIIFHNSRIFILKKGNNSSLDGFCFVICNVYDNNTFLHFKQKTFHGNFNKNAFLTISSTVVNDTFVIAFHGSINLIDPLTLETLRIIKFDDEFVMSKYIDIYGVLIAVKHTRSCCKSELWDVFRMSKLLSSGLNKIYYNSVFFLDSLCTKIVFVSCNNIYVDHLW